MQRTQRSKVLSPDFYESREWTYLRRQCLERDDWTCQNPGCPSPHESLQVHHRVPRSVAPELAYDLGNLVTLCSWCHSQEHQWMVPVRTWVQNLIAANDDQYEMFPELLALPDRRAGQT